MKEVTQSVTPQDKWVLARGLNLHYLDWGGEGRQPMLLLHGLQDCAACWDFSAPKMTAWYHVLALDHRGHGDSPRAPDDSYKLADYVGELTEVINALDLKSLVLIGHSAGGKNAFIYASQHSERLDRLVIVDMDPDAANPGSATMFQRYRTESDTWADLNAVMERLRIREPNASEETLRHHAAVLTKERADGSREWKRDRALVFGYERPDAWDALDKIACPTLLVRGSDSTILTRDVAIRMQKRIPDCRFEEFPDSGHWCYDENPEAFDKALLGFLGKS